MILFSYNCSDVISSVMETIAKIAASVASQARPEKQEPQVKMEAADQRSWGLDLR